MHESRSQSFVQSGRSPYVLATFIVFVLLGGLAVGYLNPPSGWYAGLHKPSFNPPNWLFAPTWSLLYVLIAFAGWRTWEGNSRGLAMTLWWLQMVLNFIWSPTFFSLHSPVGTLAIILALLAAILAFIATQWRRDRLAATFFLPYVAWVTFAFLLNEEIVRLNF